MRTDHQVGADDVLTMTVHERLLVWKILDPGTRRGPPAEARGLYEDLSPPPLPREAKTAPFVERDLGTGRPTKKDRRDTDRLRDETE